MNDLAKLLAIALVGGTLIVVAEIASRFRIRRMDLFNAGRRAGLAEANPHSLVDAAVARLSEGTPESFEAFGERYRQFIDEPLEVFSGEGVRPPPRPRPRVKASFLEEHEAMARGWGVPKDAIERVSEQMSDDAWIMGAARREIQFAVEKGNAESLGAEIGRILARHLRGEMQVRSALLEIATLQERADAAGS